MNECDENRRNVCDWIINRFHFFVYTKIGLYLRQETYDGLKSQLSWHVALDFQHEFYFGKYFAKIYIVLGIRLGDTGVHQ